MGERPSWGLLSCARGIGFLDVPSFRASIPPWARQRSRIDVCGQAKGTVSASLVIGHRGMIELCLPRKDGQSRSMLSVSIQPDDVPPFFLYGRSGRTRAVDTPCFQAMLEKHCLGACLGVLGDRGQVYQLFDPFSGRGAKSEQLNRAWCESNK